MKNAGRHLLAQKIIEHDVHIFAEIGIWHGETTKFILEYPGIPITEYWAIDQWTSYQPQQPRMKWLMSLTKETWDQYHIEVCKLMLQFPTLRIVRASSVQAGQMFPDNFFDMVFIDADHAFLSVKQDNRTWFPKVKSDGILGGDDMVPGHPNVRKAVFYCFGNDNVIVDSKRNWWVYKNETKRCN